MLPISSSLKAPVLSSAHTTTRPVAVERLGRCHLIRRATLLADTLPSCTMERERKRQRAEVLQVQPDTRAGGLRQDRDDSLRERVVAHGERLRRQFATVLANIPVARDWLQPAYSRLLHQPEHERGAAQV